MNVNLIIFYIILPLITRTPNNLNFFLFPLKVQIIGSRLYLRKWREGEGEAFFT